MGFITDLFKPKVTSTNSNNAAVTGSLTPTMNMSGAASGVLGSALGVPGSDPALASSGFANYEKNAGFQNAMKMMEQGTIGNQAANGLLRSGATQTALLDRGTALNQQYYNNYLQHLLGLTQAGNQAGSVITGAGQGQTGPSTFGQIASGIGSIASIF